jgi:hypothetical protein
MQDKICEGVREVCQGLGIRRSVDGALTKYMLEQYVSEFI